MCLFKRKTASEITRCLEFSRLLVRSEVPCQYPRSGGGLTPLPERCDFARTAHLNDFLRAEAASHSQVHFITSPPDFCDDPAIGDNPALRWDGTHYGPAGGTFVWNHIRDQLLGLP